jgi:hypothetical protein
LSGTSPPAPLFLVLRKKSSKRDSIKFISSDIISSVMKMKKDITLHGNNAKVGKVSKQVNSRNKTNTAVKVKGQPFDEEFARKEVDNIRL